MFTRDRKLWIVLAAAAVGITLATVLASCSGGSQASKPPDSQTMTAGVSAVPKSPVSPTWITPEVTSTEVTVPLDMVQTRFNVHFKVTLDKGNAYYMAYVNGGKTYVRAGICPPCRSVSFTLVKNTLVCDSCGTVFSAPDGKGISGACMNYPKASVPFQTSDGKIVMVKADLLTAFENTMSPGLP